MTHNKLIFRMKEQLIQVIFNRFIVFFITILISATYPVNANSQTEFTTADFVGTWYSSRADTTIVINADGTWDLPNIGSSGWWLLKTDQILWMYDSPNEEEAEDINDILYLDDNKFTLKELDDSITEFERIQN